MARTGPIGAREACAFAGGPEPVAGHPGEPQGRAYPYLMLSLPRSARLAAWGTAVLTDGLDPALAVAAVTRDDEPHAVTADFEVSATLGLAPKGGLLELLLSLQRHGTPSLSVALPAPGDTLGLPGPPTFNESATDAGECVLAHEGAGPAIGIVPHVTEFGSVYEPGAMVSWEAHSVGRRRVTDLGSVGEADRELRSALAEAIEELGRRHRAYGVLDAHYAMVGETLLWSLEQALGPAFTPELRSAWQAAYRRITSIMIDRVVTG